MKKVFILLIAGVCSCKATKLDKNGHRVLTQNYKHFKKVHPHGTNAGGRYIR